MCLFRKEEKPIDKLDIYTVDPVCFMRLSVKFNFIKMTEVGNTSTGIYLQDMAFAPSDSRPKIFEERGRERKWKKSRYQIRGEIAWLCCIITVLTQMIHSDLCKHRGTDSALPGCL